MFLTNDILIAYQHEWLLEDFWENQNFKLKNTSLGNFDHEPTEVFR